MTTLSRLAAALADRYRVERELGAGGMATVFLAHDLKHEREVAIKVLHPDLGAALGAERFLAEIKTTAKLQHPHILGLIDSGAADGLLFYVMPFVRGETLRARLERERQLPVPDAVRLAREVASALDYAHRQGVIHRDIKPENILLQDGNALVADFGIALAVQQAGGVRMTQTGLSLGTPQYMSPEQAMGERQIDARADVYAVGAITYEMLTGEPPFSGPTVQAVVARLLSDTPRGITEQRKSVPPHVEAAVFRALEKLPADRFATAAEFSEALRGGTGAAGPPFGRPAAAATAVSGARRARTWALVACSVVGAAAVGWVAGRGTAPEATDDASIEFALRIPGSERTNRTDIAISRDGRRIARAVQDSLGRRQIAIRELGSSQVRIVPGGEGALNAYFSPDGDTLAFVTDATLRRIPVSGGASIALATGVNPSAVEWGEDGYVYFSRNGSGLHRVPAAGGKLEQLTTPDRARREFIQWSPQLLPDGKQLLFATYAFPADSSRVELMSLGDRKRRTLITNAFNPRFIPPDRLVFLRDSALMAVAFDATTGTLRGEPAPVRSDVAWDQTTGLAGYAVSRSGTLVFIRADDARVTTQVRWLDRTGRPLENVTDPGPWTEAVLSPDGRTIALSKAGLPIHLWTFDIRRRVLVQLSRSPTASFSPVWTPDSRALVHVGETPVYDIVRTDIETGRVDTLLTSEKDKFPSSLSPDGQRVLYTEAGDRDLIKVFDRVSGKSEAIDSTEVFMGPAVFSPDGRWLAYATGGGGKTQVFVRALDGSGRRAQVSADGGAYPRWTRNGREVVFRRGDAVLSATFDPVRGEPGRPVELFSSPMGPSLANGRTAAFDVAPDGSRFLMRVALRRPEALPIVVVTQWTRRLRGSGTP